MKFKAVIEDPWLSQKYEYVIESENIAPVYFRAAERALAHDEKYKKLRPEYKKALDSGGRDMVVSSIKQETIVILIP